jgi:hypothetical protein
MHSKTIETLAPGVQQGSGQSRKDADVTHLAVPEKRCWCGFDIRFVINRGIEAGIKPGILKTIRGNVVLAGVR